MSAFRLSLPAGARRRAGPALIALAIELLVALALLLFLVAPHVIKRDTPALSVFNVDRSDSHDASKSAPERTATRTRQQKAATAPPAALPPPPPIRAAHPALSPPPGLIALDGEQFAKSDIGKLPAHPDSGAGEGEGDSGGAGGGSTYGPGAGPGGAPLYNAEWYREPSHAEIAGYLPHNVESGSAMIACRTIENYHVENCQSLGEEPAGTGLARAMRQAAWQFLVRPPRRGGKVLIGAWVRIRFDLTTGVEK